MTPKKSETINVFPTSRQVDALLDVVAHPLDTLAQRARRFGCSRPAVLSLLMQLERRALAMRSDGKWFPTRAGRAWIRPTMPTRRAAP
jgi:hypothetical protein